VLSELDRKRILACLTNLRMICNSTWLYDKATHVSPKLDEFAAIIEEFTAESPDRKAVVFSQWEQMLHEAAGVLDGLGVGYAVLTGRLPAASRKDPIARFRDDPACRMFLSTDAGGTGLNLQAADTVIHLEVPWNPAVLEQRIARVHRLGQSRPVRVIRLVTRNTVEERVLEVLGQKRALFEGLFEGDSDEVSFAAPGQPAFLDAIRAALGLAGEPPQAPAPPAGDRLLRAGVELLEALAEVLASRGTAADPALADRGRQAAEALARALAPDDGRAGDASPPVQ
jgi:superfamily II DNA or RNA helicase